MPKHNSHHFVPAFILREWQTPPDGKLSAFSWINGSLLHERYKAKSVAKQIGLYSLRNEAGVSDNVIEREFFGKVIDDPAAVVHRRILSDGIASLSAGDWYVWDRFLVAQMLRSPRMIIQLRGRGAEIFTRSLLRPESKHDEKSDSSDFTVSQWIEQNPDSLSSDNLSIASIPAIVDSDLLYDNMRNAGSVTVALPSQANFNFLIGDQALSYVGTMNTEFVILLPIAPTVAFVKCDSRETAEKIRRLSARRLAGDSNFTTVTNAERWVYATDDRQSRFVARHLSPPA